MPYGLNLDILPIYCFSSFKTFGPGEKHLTRICEDDVLIIMLEGTLYFHEDHKAVEVTQGQYYIQKRGIFQEGLTPSSNARYYYIHFKGSFENSPNTLPIMGSAYFSESYESFSRLNFLQNTGASHVEKSAEFYRILTKLKTERGTNPNKKIVLKVISLITEDYQKTYSLEQLSAACGYSKNYLINVFKNETGQTPFSYITGLRLNTAKTYLADSDMSITEISEKCGFGSYINFYKAFTGRMGTTPDKWRRENRGL